MKKVIGKYTITKRLGQGSFAEVFLGEDNITGKPLAVKMINRSKMDKMGVSKQMIEKEKQIMF